VQAAMNAGMNAHIAKPLDPDVLVATLGKILNVVPVA
jgi:CheY-like chemotaxis protein